MAEIAAAPRSRSTSAGAQDEEVDLGDEVVAEPPSSSSKVDVAGTATETRSPDQQRSISIVGSGKRGGQENEKIQVPPSKRPRPAGADATRQKRLFGVLTKTLSRFNEDTKKETEASKRRAAVEERLAAKLQEERDAHEAKAGKEKARRNLKYDIMKKEDDKKAFIAIIQTRRATKERLANFLCTKHSPAEGSAGDLGGLPAAAYPALPHAIAPADGVSVASRPLYYLPAKLLPWQTDQIDAQVEDMRTELEKEQENWNEELNKREIELEELRRTREEQEGDHKRSRDEQGTREGNDNQHSDRSGRAPLPRRHRSDSIMSQSDERYSKSPQQATDEKISGTVDDSMLEY